LIYEYWKHHNGEFEETLTKLAEKHPFTAPQISALAKKRSVLAVATNVAACVDCGQRVTVQTRQSLKHVHGHWYEQSACDVCAAKKVNEEARERLHTLYEASPPVRSLPPVGQQAIDELTYFEKLSYAAAISTGRSLDEAYVYYAAAPQYTCVDSFDAKITNKLIEAGLLYRVYETPGVRDYYNELVRFVSRHKQVIDDEIHFHLEAYDKGRFRSGFYALLPDDCESFFDLGARLVEDISNHQLSIDEAKLIEQWVIRIKLEAVNKIVLKATDYYRVPVEDSLKLEGVLLALIGKYNLGECNSIIWFQSKNVGAKLRAEENKLNHMRTPIYIARRLFCRHVETYMEYLEREGKRPNSYQPWEENSPSLVESFVSSYLIGERPSWAEFSANEILSLWLGSSAVD
jgi:hypothetical protein